MRIGLSQAEVAAIGGLGKQTQLNYEADTRSPDAAYLLALKAVGIDVWYVLTGERAIAVLNDDESDILGAYRQLNEAGKGFIQRMLALYVNDGSMTADGLPAPPERRVKRLSENRMAAVGERTAENVRKATEIAERARAQRAATKKDSSEE
ncbi:hypothetical protein R69746_06175 [Paraburkholderia aspalathi]|nr:hypothetical protein R69746_06175 [Paraburkholderia aspalathi]